jgi:DNA-binding XRE family transcriptional regulator
VNLAQEMIDYRARNNLSQLKFAELIGLNPNSIYMLESGKSKPRATTISKMQTLIEKEGKR